MILYDSSNINKVSDKFVKNIKRNFGISYDDDLLFFYSSGVYSFIGGKAKYGLGGCTSGVFWRNKHSYHLGRQNGFISWEDLFFVKDFISFTENAVCLGYDVVYFDYGLNYKIAKNLVDNLILNELSVRYDAFFDFQSLLDPENIRFDLISIDDLYNSVSSVQKQIDFIERISKESDGYIDMARSFYFSNKLDKIS